MEKNNIDIKYAVITIGLVIGILAIISIFQTVKLDKCETKVINYEYDYKWAEDQPYISIKNINIIENGELHEITISFEEEIRAYQFYMWLTENPEGKIISEGKVTVKDKFGTVIIEGKHDAGETISEMDNTDDRR